MMNIAIANILEKTEKVAALHYRTPAAIRSWSVQKTFGYSPARIHRSDCPERPKHERDDGQSAIGPAGYMPMRPGHRSQSRHRGS